MMIFQIFIVPLHRQEVIIKENKSHSVEKRINSNKIYEKNQDNLCLDMAKVQSFLALVQAFVSR